MTILGKLAEAKTSDFVFPGQRPELSGMALEMVPRRMGITGATVHGFRSLIDLEAGKPSCQLGRSLLVAEVLGLRLADMITSSGLSATAQELPDLPEEVQE